MAWEVHFSPFTHCLHTESHRSCPFSWVESGSLRHRMQIANFSRLAACLYPDALEEECLMMSYYHLWVLLFVCVSYSLLLFRLGCFRYSFGMMVQRALTVYRLSFLTFVFSMPRAWLWPSDRRPPKCTAFQKRHRCSSWLYTGWTTFQWSAPSHGSSDVRFL